MSIDSIVAILPLSFTDALNRSVSASFSSSFYFNDRIVCFYSDPHVRPNIISSFSRFCDIGTRLLALLEPIICCHLAASVNSSLRRFSAFSLLISTRTVPFSRRSLTVIKQLLSVSYFAHWYLVVDDHSSRKSDIFYQSHNESDICEYFRSDRFGYHLRHRPYLPSYAIDLLSFSTRSPSSGVRRYFIRRKRLLRLLSFRLFLLGSAPSTFSHSEHNQLQHCTINLLSLSAQ